MSKKVFSLFVLVFFITVLQSCSNDENSKNIQTFEEKEINATNIAKSWIVTHFAFTKECDKGNKTKYQLSSIHLDLRDNRYKAIDKYSLIEDEGSWEINGNIIELVSDKRDVYLKFKIIKLSEFDLELDVLGHSDLNSVELVIKK